MAAMCVQFQNCEQRGKLCFIRLRRSKPHVCLDRPPRQQPRLLKYHADPCTCRTRHAALIVMVETARIFSMVLLPHPDGPTNTPTSPAPSAKLKSESTSNRSPAAFVNALRAISTSSCTGPPPR